MKPLLLDLFSGAGGCAKGYADAGFQVVGCDLAAQPRYPYEFWQDDALACLDTLLSGKDWHGYKLSDFAAIHASPPCQDYSASSNMVGTRGSGRFPRLIKPVRERLIATGLPWVLENVRLALEDMLNPLMLCGTALGLRTQRHRLFDSNMLIFGAGPCRHRTGDISVRCKKIVRLGVPSGSFFKCKNGRIEERPQNATVADARVAMGIDWMTMHELGEAIPPAYTRWIGQQLISIVEVAA